MLKIYDIKENSQYIDIPLNRISILGGSGSGKSTLATILSQELNIPSIHLDAINYTDNWVEIDKNKRDLIIKSKIQEEKWIIDGNYKTTLTERLDKSDLIIWLDYSTFAHLKGVLKRIIKNYNKEKPEIPQCKERFNLKFIKFVIFYNKKKRPTTQKILTNYSQDKILIFKKQKDLNKWLKNFTKNENILNKYI